MHIDIIVAAVEYFIFKSAISVENMAHNPG